MLGTLDVPGPGVDIRYHLVNSVGDPVHSSVAGLEVWKPDGADWLGQGPTSGLGLVWQWGRQLHMDATAFATLEVPIWYKNGIGPIDVRVFCVTGTSSGPWVETQMDSETVTLNRGDAAILTVNLTTAPDRTRMVKVGVVVEAHDPNMKGQAVILHIGSIPMATVMLENYGPNSAYRWLDVADQAYSEAYRNTYSYDNATVRVTYYTVGQTLSGTLIATNLKPNFAYQLKLQAEPTHRFGDTNYGTNELVGLRGRWWEQEWQGGSWTTGWNLNDKGNGWFPNPNDSIYYVRRDVPDVIGGSPTGLRYKYTAYRVFGYFITDENGNATLNYATNNSYHVLWKTSQYSPGLNDGPVVTRRFDVDPSVHNQYNTDYPNQTVSIFGEWERLPKDGVEMLPGDYTCDILLTEESFHGSGLQGFWAHALRGQIEFTIVPHNSGRVGDLSEDYRANFKDLLILSAQWLWHGPAGTIPEDITADGTVNFPDFAAIAGNWLNRWNQPPVVTITTPRGGDVIYFRPQGVINIEADASDVDGSVVKVEFFVDGSKVAEDNDGADGWRANWLIAAAGSYSITARATDDEGATTTSAAVQVKVVKPPR